MGGRSVLPDFPVDHVAVDQIGQLTMREWCASWKYEEPLRATLVGHEVNPQFLQIGGPEESFYHISIEACIGDCIDQIQMLLPVRGIDSIIRHLAIHTTVDSEEEAEEHEEFIRQMWNPAYDLVKAKVAAQWADIPITTRGLSDLKEGDLIPLDPDRLRDVELTIAGKPKFRGRLGSFDQKSLAIYSRTNGSSVIPKVSGPKPQKFFQKHRKRRSLHDFFEFLCF